MSRKVQMRKEKSLKSFLFDIYAYSFFNKFLLLAPVYAIFMQEHGMTGLQLSSLLIILSVATFGVQIPATWVANKIGNKKAIALGQILKVIGFTLWFIFPVYWSFAVGMFLWGIQTAFFNVSFEGLMYDELAARKRTDVYTKALGIRYNIQSVAVGLAAFGSLLLYLGYSWIFGLSALTMFLSVFFIMRVQTKSKHANKIESLSEFWNNFKSGIKISFSTPHVASVLLLTTLVANLTYLNEFVSPISIDIGVRPQFVGFVQFFILVCYVIGQTFAYKFEKVRPVYLGSAIAVSGILFILFSQFYSVAGLVFLGLSYVLFSGINVLLFAGFQNLIPAKQRPVMLSLYSIGDNIFYIGTCLIMGFGESLGSWRYSILILGVFLIILGIYGCCVIHQKQQKHIQKNIRPIGKNL